MLSLAWFLGVRFPEPDLEGAFVSLVIGPIQDESVCNAYDKFLRQNFGQIKGVQFLGCKKAI